MCALLCGNGNFVFECASGDGDTLQVRRHCAVQSLQPPLFCRPNARRDLKRLEIAQRALDAVQLRLALGGSRR